MATAPHYAAAESFSPIVAKSHPHDLVENRLLLKTPLELRSDDFARLMALAEAHARENGVNVKKLARYSSAYGLFFQSKPPGRKPRPTAD